jgi:ArsR family transcriptional regulator
MDQTKAIDAFSALAQETRMAIYRMLVQKMPNGLRVGEISQRLDIVPSTLSGHLAVLKRAGLLKSTRHQREIHYSADLGTMNKLVSFMLQDCCNGQVENCGEILMLLDRA